MSMENPLISVITVCLNSEKTIESTLKSMLSQTYDNYEYIICDGCSTDATLDIVRKYEAQFNGRLRIYQEKDTGMYNAINKGIEKCTGKLIGILNSDDYYSDNTLELVAKKYEEEAHELIVINGDMERVNDDGEVIHRYHFTQGQVDRKEYFGHPSMFAAKAVYDKIGGYDESYRWAGDGDWQYRAHEDEEVRYVLCPHVFNHMREGGASDMFKYRWVWFKERTRLKLAHNRGHKLKIYMEELFSVFKTDVKNVLPAGLHKKVYSILYRKVK